jgi:hypothetical protein
MDLSYATIRDLVQRYRAKKTSGTANKTSSTVDTIMRSLRQQYERHTAERDADLFGDLTWLTAAEETLQVDTPPPAVPWQAPSQRLGG